MFSVAPGSARVLPAFQASLPAHSELHSQPQKAAPRRRQLFSVCCFSPCLLDVHSQLWWLNETTRSPRSCWYSCLPWGLTTGPGKGGQRNGLGPWHWPPSLLTSPTLKRSRPSQLSSESSPSPAGCILLACILQLDVDYLPAAQAPVWSDDAPDRSPGTDFDMWQKSDHGEDHLRSEDISHAAAEQKFWGNKSNYIWADAMEPSHQSNGFAQHTRPPFCRGSTVDLSHMKESLSHRSLPINLFKSDQSPSTRPLLDWGI